jgi:serine/threonine-protein kinase HipA
VQLRELEAASLALERDEDNVAPEGDDWLRMLIAPGGSLGGARPKASVVDPNGQPWIAKFPSTRDEHDIGAWELVLQTLARGCGLRVPESLANQVIEQSQAIVRQWPKVATRLRIPAREQQRLASAFRLAG